jgi:hypothetical protein
MKKSNDTIGNRTRDLTACSPVPPPDVIRVIEWWVGGEMEGRVFGFEGT